MRTIRFMMLVALWVALWSDLSIANVLSGALVAAAIMATFRTWSSGRVILRPVPALVFAGYFAYKLVESTVVVARTVITPSRRVHNGIVAVPLMGCSDALVTLIAQVISLTPGTLTLEVRRNPLVLYVHALDVRDVDAVRSGVHRLERLAIRAFGPSEALDALDEDHMTTWRGR